MSLVQALSHYDGSFSFSNLDLRADTHSEKVEAECVDAEDGARHVLAIVDVGRLGKKGLERGATSYIYRTCHLTLRSLPPVASPPGRP